MNSKNKQDWRTKKLGEVCEVSAGNSAPQKKELFKNGKFPFFRTADVGKVHISNNLIIAKDYLNKKGIEGLRLFRKGTILMPKSGASTFLNHRVILGVDGYVASHLATINTDEDILITDYLFHLLKNIKAQDLIQNHAYPSLKLSDIKEIKISFPKSLTEQKRIVKILDGVFADIEETRENAEKNLENAKELFESYLENIFEDDNDWEEDILKNLTLKIGSGATPRGGKKSYKKSGISLIRSMNVHDRFFKKKNLAFIDEKQAKLLDNVKVFKKDVLLNITGASVARCCIVPEYILPARVNQHVSIIRTKNNIINADFLNLLLTSKIYKDILLGIGEQGATRQAITKVQIENLKIRFPSLKTQKQIVKKLDELSEQVKEYETILQNKITDLDELKKSVLEKAFDGEL